VNSHSTALLDYLAGRAAVAYQGTGQGVHGCDGTAPAATVNAIGPNVRPRSHTAGGRLWM
jgi:hypothetical protein